MCMLTTFVVSAFKVFTLRRCSLDKYQQVPFRFINIGTDDVVVIILDLSLYVLGVQLVVENAENMSSETIACSNCWNIDDRSNAIDTWPITTRNAAFCHNVLTHSCSQWPKAA